MTQYEIKWIKLPILWVNPPLCVRSWPIIFSRLKLTSFQVSYVLLIRSNFLLITNRKVNKIIYKTLLQVQYLKREKSICKKCVNFP